MGCCGCINGKNFFNLSNFFMIVGGVISQGIFLFHPQQIWPTTLVREDKQYKSFGDGEQQGLVQSSQGQDSTKPYDHFGMSNTIRSKLPTPKLDQVMQCQPKDIMDKYDNDKDLRQDYALIWPKKGATQEEYNKALESEFNHWELKEDQDASQAGNSVQFTGKKGQFWSLHHTIFTQYDEFKNTAFWDFTESCDHKSNDYEEVNRVKLMNRATCQEFKNLYQQLVAQIVLGMGLQFFHLVYFYIMCRQLRGVYNLLYVVVILGTSVQLPQGQIYKGRMFQLQFGEIVVLEKGVPDGRGFMFSHFSNIMGEWFFVNFQAKYVSQIQLAVFGSMYAVSFLYSLFRHKLFIFEKAKGADKNEAAKQGRQNRV